MRIRLLLACVSVGVFGLGLTVQACGGSATDEAAGDAGADAPDARPRIPTGLDAGEARCDPDKDLLAAVRDASIGDGASSTGLCNACAKAQCSEAIAKCTRDCPCQAIVSDALECYLTTRQIGCAAALANIFVTNETRRDALSLLGCVQTECVSECAVDAGTGTDRDASAADADAE